MNEIVKAALTPCQLRVAEALLDGLSDHEIAGRLGICEQSVKHSLKRMFLKFQIEPPCGGRSGKRIVLAARLLCA
jgi:DNA-binding NarL/FixJ family response regulator